MSPVSLDGPHVDSPSKLANDILAALSEIDFSVALGIILLASYMMLLGLEVVPLDSDEILLALLIA